MSEALVFQVETVIHQLDTGLAVAYPLADPDLSVVGEPDRVIEDLRQGLVVHLEKISASDLGSFFLPGGDLHWIEVRLSRGRVGRLAERHLTYDIPCLVIPEGKGFWVRALIVAPALNRLTFFLDRGEDLEARCGDEVGRALDALPERGVLLRELAAQRDVRTETLEVSVRRGGSGDGSSNLRSAAERRREARTERDVELLKSVGTFVDVSVVRHLDAWSPRDAEQGRLEALFSGSRRLSALVVGEPGVGKTALIRRLALTRKRVLVTSGTRWVAGQSMLGQLEEKAWQVLGAAERLDAVLYFDSLDELLGHRDASTGLAGLLRPWLDRERVRLVAEIDPGRLDGLSRRHTGFLALFHKIELPPLDAATTRGLLMQRGEATELPKWRRRQLAEKKSTAHPPARFADEESAAVLVEAVQRYFPYGKLPGEALRLADELATLEQVGGVLSPGPGARLTVESIYRGLSHISGIPAMLLRADTPLKLEHLRRGLRQSLIGQDEAVERLATGLCAVKARLQPEGRPLAVLLFVGPTGVGKTQAARALARLLYGSEDRLLRFDMSEFADPWSADRLIRGTAGDEGLLTRKVRREPFSLLLLDEIEKAHDAVFDLLLQVFGEGRLSDAKGRTTYFHNCLIILTSNLGATQRRSQRTGFGDAGPSSSKVFYDEQVRKRFRPELVNRLDRVVPFEPLTRQEAVQVTALQVASLARRRGFDERDLKLEVDDAVIEDLARRAYSPQNGARALRRHMQRSLAEPVAEWLSELGAEGRRGVLRVRLAPADGEVDEAPAPKTAATRPAGPLLLELHGNADREVADSKSIDRLHTRRRAVRDMLSTPGMEALQDQLLLIEQQMQERVVGKEKGKGGAEVADRSRLHHRLRSAWRPLQELRQEIEELEELALSSYLAGDPTEPWIEDLEAFDRRWWRAVPPGLWALAPPRDRILLIAEELDTAGALGSWLPGLMEKGKTSGWKIRACLVAGAKVTEQPLDGADLLDAVADPERSLRALLLEVEAPDAGWWLASEACFQRFVGVGPKGDETAHLRVRRAAFAGLSPEILERCAGLRLGRTVPARRLAAESPGRIYDFKQNKVTFPHLEGFHLAPAEYWPHYELVVSKELLRFEYDEDLDRDRDLGSLQLKKGRAPGDSAPDDSDGTDDDGGDVG